MPLPPPALHPRAAWLAVLLALPGLAWAAADAAPGLQDVSVLAGTCANCHRPDGRTGGDIPALRGQPASRLLQRMQSFKAGTALDATVMTRLMKGYDDAQIQALAQWFGRQQEDR